MKKNLGEKVLDFYKELTFNEYNKDKISINNIKKIMIYYTTAPKKF